MGDEKVGLHSHLIAVPVLGLVTIPVEDFAETAYDESEAEPHKSGALISNPMPQAAVSATQAMRSWLRCQLFTTAMRINRRHAQHSTEARVALGEQWIDGFRRGLCK